MREKYDAMAIADQRPLPLIRFGRHFVDSAAARATRLDGGYPLSLSHIGGDHELAAAADIIRIAGSGKQRSCARRRAPRRRGCRIANNPQLELRHLMISLRVIEGVQRTIACLACMVRSGDGRDVIKKLVSGPAPLVAPGGRSLGCGTIRGLDAPR